MKEYISDNRGRQMHLAGKGNLLVVDSVEFLYSTRVSGLSSSLWSRVYTQDTGQVRTFSIKKTGSERTRWNITE